ncbi:hypothetical protein VDGL01_08724 [Verticillium dahliae]
MPAPVGPLSDARRTGASPLPSPHPDSSASWEGSQPASQQAAATELEEATRPKPDGMEWDSTNGTEVRARTYLLEGPPSIEYRSGGAQVVHRISLPPRFSTPSPPPFPQAPPRDCGEHGVTSM